MSNIPAVNQFATDEDPRLATLDEIHGAPWQVDWRDVYPVASDEIRNHDTPAFLGVYDGTESCTDWNPWEGVTGPHPRTVIRYGYGTPGVQEFAQDAPLAIDTFNMQNTNGQAVMSGVSSIAALVPFLSLPDAGIGTNDLDQGHSLPFHFDRGLQRDMAQAIGPRQVFREPPSFGDQSAAVYAAGF